MFVACRSSFAGLSGKLTEEKNVFNGVVVKYSEPPEARIPKRRWRFYVFKGDETLPTLYLHRQSAYLMGRERKVADIPLDHPSVSKQHAVLQFRLVAYERADGSAGRTVRPYLIDLEAANGGTYVNNQRVKAKRYVALLEKEVERRAQVWLQFTGVRAAARGEPRQRKTTWGSLMLLLLHRE